MGKPGQNHIFSSKMSSFCVCSILLASNYKMMATQRCILRVVAKIKVEPKYISHHLSQQQTHCVGSSQLVQNLNFRLWSWFFSDQTTKVTSSFLTLPIQTYNSSNECGGFVFIYTEDLLKISHYARNYRDEMYPIWFLHLRKLQPDVTK